MATFTRWFVILQRLGALMQALPGYRDPDAPASGVPVFVGPTYGITGDQSVVWLALGWAGEPSRSQELGQSGQAVATLGNRGRDENGRIRCRVTGQTGDRSPAATQDAVSTVLGDVEGLLRSNPTLGLDQSWMRSAEMGDDLRVSQFYAAGFVCQVDFTIHYRTRI